MVTKADQTPFSRNMLQSGKESLLGTVLLLPEKVAKNMSVRDLPCLDCLARLQGKKDTPSGVKLTSTQG